MLHELDLDMLPFVGEALTQLRHEVGDTAGGPIVYSHDTRYLDLKASSREVKTRARYFLYRWVNLFKTDESRRRYMWWWRCEYTMGPGCFVYRYTV